MSKETRVETDLARRLGDEGGHDYPDFDAMWTRIDAARQEYEAESLGRQGRTMFLRGRRLAVLSAVALVLIATPVLASMSGHWDFTFRPGVKSALNHGFGQTIDKSVTNSGVTFTVDSAMSDDNGTTLLYSFDPGDEEPLEWRFSEVELRTADGEPVVKVNDVQSMRMNWKKGYYSHIWDKENKRYNGFLETPWTFDGKETELQLSVRGLQVYNTKRLPLALDLAETGVQTFPVQDGGIESASIQISREAEGKMVLKSLYTYWDERIANTNLPAILVKKDGKLMERSGTRVGLDNGKWAEQEIYQLDDIHQQNITFELAYMTPGKKIDGEWNLGGLRLNKEKALHASAIRTLDVPVRTTEGEAVVRKLFIRPTGIRVEIEHGNSYSRLPYKGVYLSVGGRKLEGEEWLTDNTGEGSHYVQTYVFDAPPDLRLTADLPMELLLQYEVEEKWDYKQPILLSHISGEKQTLTMDVGEYPVRWTYYKQNGDLYVESESSDERFGGINQTFIRQEDRRIPGHILFDWIPGAGLNDSLNKRVDVYPGFEETEAEMYIFMYLVRHPERELTVKLQ
ncbi:DUF4179 domain-containing protein [Paenibacillus dendritiformis]|uniref:DUF4179 domain-containing protein n=1 Tax=Paenibacillus dendritiformis TaxID=130049 RepID=UPI000DA728C7|nr:DUF4179 domain-containing protein [Paenibacillus dendritiformis]PZM67681.1 RNA polymerase subunit sigma-70 [Paenibacillus dendritiformis]